MIRILQYGMTSTIGGVETFIMNMYRSMDKTKVQFDFILSHNAPKIAFEDEIIRLGGRVFRVLYGVRENPLLAVKSLKNFFEEHRDEYKAIHMNTCVMGNAMLLKYAKKYGVQMRIFHSHIARENYPAYSASQKIMLYINRNGVNKNATHLFACSDLAGKYMFPSKKFNIIPNAINTGDFKFNEDNRKLYRAQIGVAEKYVIGYVGRLNEDKNPLRIIEIFSEVKKRCTNAHLIMIGEGPLEQQIREKIYEYDLASNVSMLGKRMDVAKWYSAFDCFLLTSHYEGLGIVLIEAQCAGLPCVATANTVPNEARCNEEFSFVPLSASSSVWADEVLKYRNIKYNRENGQKSVNNAGYDLNVVAEQLQAFYLS